MGDILKRFKENEKIRELLTGRGFLATLDCVMIFVYLALMIYYNLPLTLVALGFIAGYVILTLAITPRLKRLNRETFRRAAEAESNLVESISGVGTVKATASEMPVRWKWEGLMVRALNVKFRTAMTGVTSNAITSLLQSLNAAFLLWFGARLVIADELTIGQLMAFTAIAANMMRPVTMLVELWGDFQEVSVGMERLNDIFETPPEEDAARPGLMRLPPIKGHLRFEGVTFRYPTRPDRNALENINLEIYPGQTVALIGRSGAGKSTFAGLLLRIHVPNRGRILIDGQDLRQVSIPSLRSQIGVVPQEVVLFSGTIRENIAFGQPDAPLEEVPRGRDAGGRARFHPGPAARVRDDRRRARRKPVRWAAAADRHRPRAVQESADSDFRRSHQRARHRKRARHSTESRPHSEGPDDVDHRASAEHRSQRRPDRGDGQWRYRGNWHAFQPDGAEGHVLLPNSQQLEG